MWSLIPYPECCNICEGQFINSEGKTDCKITNDYPDYVIKKLCRHWHPKEINPQWPEWVKTYIVSEWLNIC